MCETFKQKIIFLYNLGLMSHSAFDDALFLLEEVSEEEIVLHKF